MTLIEHDLLAALKELYEFHVSSWPKYTLSRLNQMEENRYENQHDGRHGSSGGRLDLNRSNTTQH